MSEIRTIERSRTTLRRGRREFLLRTMFLRRLKILKIYSFTKPLPRSGELLRRYGLNLANSYAPLGSCLPCQGDGRTHTAASLGYVQGSAARVRLERPYPLTAKLPMRATAQERLDGGHPAAAPRHLCRSRPRKCHSRSKLRGLSASTNPEQELAAAE